MWQIIVSERVVVGWLLAFSTIAYGFFAFNLTLSGDDWIAVLDPRNRQDFFRSIGRISHDPIARELLTPRFAPAVSAAFLWSCLVFCGVWIARSFNVRKPIPLFIVACLFALCPIWAEQMSFKDNHAAVGTSLVLATFASFTVLDGPDGKHKTFDLQKSFVAALALGFALTFHQMVALFFVTLCVAVALNNLATGRFDTGRVLATAVTSVVSLLGALFVYVVFTRVTQAISETSNLPETYSAASGLIASWDDVVQTFSRLCLHLWTFLFEQQHLWSFTLKCTFLVILCLTLIRLADRLKALGAGRAALTIALLVSVFLAPWMFGLFWVPDNAYRYNALFAVALIYPTIIALALTFWPAGRGHLVIVALSGFIILHFASAHNVAALAAYTTNQRDFAVLERMLMHVETHQEYAKIDSSQPLSIVVVVGNNEKHVPSTEPNQVPFTASASGSTMKDSIVQCGVLYCQPGRIQSALAFIDYDYPHAKRGVFIAFGESDLMNSGYTEETEAAIRNAPFWPLPGAVIFEGNTVFIRSR